MKKNVKKFPNKDESFDFDKLPSILGCGILVIERELIKLSAKSEEKTLTEAESKILISYLGILKDIKKDYLSEISSLQKELKTYTNEQLVALLGKETGLS